MIFITCKPCERLKGGRKRGTKTRLSPSWEAQPWGVRNRFLKPRTGTRCWLGFVPSGGGGREQSLSTSKSPVASAALGTSGLDLVPKRSCCWWHQRLSCVAHGHQLSPQIKAKVTATNKRANVFVVPVKTLFHYNHLGVQSSTQVPAGLSVRLICSFACKAPKTLGDPSSIGLKTEG